MSALTHRLGPRARTVGYAVLVAAAAFVVGGLFVHRTTDGMLLAGAIALAILMLDRPVVVFILAMCATFLVQRVGGSSSSAGSSGGLSYSDAILTVATVFALPMLLRSVVLQRLRPVLIGLAIYLVSLLPTLILHLSHTAELEWMHRLVLVGGAVLVGASIARADATTLALRTLTAVAVVYAVFTLVHGARSGFSIPSEPLGLNKNFIGAMLGTVAALTLCAPQPLALPRAVRYAAVAILAGGLLASYSRGSMLAAAIAVYVAALLSGRVIGRGRQVVALLLAGALTYGAYVSVHKQFTQDSSQFNNNSIGVRFNVERETLRIWRTSPVDGVGLRYFRTGNYGYFAQASNNAIDSELAESGVIGALGFLGMQGLILYAGFRRRRDGQLMLIATGLAFASLMHGMVDIYWSAGTTTLPFILLGIALGSPELKPDLARRPDERVGALEHV